MGIPGFNGWFYENNKQAYQPMVQTTVDHLYIDMNSVLHNVLRKADSYDKYHALLHKRLDAIMRLTNPRKSVMLAIDGPAPLAKLVTQRDRRKKLFSTETRKKENGGGGGRKQNGKVVSSTALTPGTPFMHDVCVSCSYYICARLANRKWQHLEFELSGPTVAGEGEVKILGRLARPRHEASVGPADTHLIVGDDADLILMALVSSTPRLYILNAALSDNTLGPQTAVLSVDRLHRVWLAKGVTGPAAAQTAAAAAAAATIAGDHQPWSQQELSQLLGAKADLAFLAIMSSGNDYLPPVKFGPKLSDLWSSYMKLRQLPQFADRSIIAINSSSTAQQQDEQMNSSSGNGGSSSSSSFMRELACSAELDVVMLAEVLAVATEGKKYWAQLQQRNSPAAGAAVYADDRLSKAAAEALPWLKGVLWTMSMYFAGDCPDYRWCYNQDAPTVQGLRALAAAATAALQSSSSSSGAHAAPDQYKLHLSSFSISCCSSGSSSSSAAVEWQATIAAAAAQLCGDSSVSLEPLLPHVCSLALLPAGAQEHLPSAVKHLMDSSSPIYDLYATCEGCEAVQQEAYVAQRAYDAILRQIRSLEAQTLAESGAADAQQQLAAAKQAELAAAKAAALAVLHAAQDKRRKHEAEEHPNGVNNFDLASLEAAVAGIPASNFRAEERALTQLSRSLLFRMDQQPDHRQWHSQQQYKQQQQYSTFSRSNSRVPGRVFRPPPPPVERFGPAFSSRAGRSNPVVLRSLIWETAFGCLVAEDPDLHMYSNYMVVGTDAAAAAASGDAAAAPDESPQHKHKQPSPPGQQQQQQHGAARDNTAAAAALKAVLRANITPMQPATTATKTDSSARAALDVASSAVAAATEALEANSIGLSPGSTQQQQRRRQGRKQGPSSPGALAQQQGSAAGNVKHARTRSQSPKPRGKQQQQQRGQSPPRASGASSGGSANNQHFYGASEASARTATAAYAPGEVSDNYSSRYGRGTGSFSAPPAADSVPLPSGLLGRVHNSAASGGTAAGGGAYTLYGQHRPHSGLAEQQWQQDAGKAATGQRYDPLHHHQQQQQHFQQQQQFYYQPQQYRQPYQPLPYQQQQCYQQTQANYVQQQQQHGGYPLQQQLQWPQPLRSVSPSSLHGYNSNYVVPQPVMPPATAAAARPAGPPYPGMHF